MRGGDGWRVGLGVGAGFGGKAEGTVMLLDGLRSARVATHQGLPLGYEAQIYNAGSTTPHSE